MKQIGKKEYTVPLLTEIPIDRTIVIQMATETKPPDLPGALPSSGQQDGTSISKPQHPTQKSGFDENPFER